MDPILITLNVYKSLWFGAYCQSNGRRIIPTVTWADERTYDICFNHIETGSIVIISTIGVGNNKNGFIKGFCEMKKRINPPLILVYGKLIEGMVGRFIFIDFKDIFIVKQDMKQLSLFEVDNMQVIEEGSDLNGRTRKLY